MLYIKAHYDVILTNRIYKDRRIIINRKKVLYVK